MYALVVALLILALACGLVANVAKGLSIETRLQVVSGGVVFLAVALLLPYLARLS